MISSSLLYPVSQQTDLNFPNPIIVDGTARTWLLNTKGNDDPLRPPRVRFVYLLGKPFVNVAEVYCLNAQDAMALRSAGFPEATDRCFISRIAEHYASNELPCQSLDKAVAGELVFTLFVRRRDAHALNRGYTKGGIPVFFDFELAFCNGGEKPEIQEFFERDEPGYPGTWRVKQTDSGHILTTQTARNSVKNNSIHFVYSISDFINHVWSFVDIF